MHTVRVTERTGKDGVLHVSIPLGTPDADFEVVVVVQPKPSAPAPPQAAESGWPPGYFDLTFASIRDESFVRPPQGMLPHPIDLDGCRICSTPTCALPISAGGVRRYGNAWPRCHRRTCIYARSSKRSCATVD